MRSAHGFLITVALLVSSLHANILRVPNDYNSIQPAIDAAANGDTVLVAPGSYSGPITFNGRLILLASTFIESGDSSLVSQTAIHGMLRFESGENSQSRLQGFTVREGSRGLSIVNSSPSISDCIVEDNSEAGVYISGANIAPTFDRLTIRNNQPRAIYIYAADPVFSDCQVHNNGIYAQGDGAGVYVDGDSADPVFTRCLFYENVCSRGGVLFAQQDSYTRFVNCTLYGNGASSNGRTLWLEDYSGTADAELLNCIIWNSVGQGSVIYVENSSCVLTANYSNIQDGWNGTGNYNLDPEFVDGSTADFRLYSHSIAVNHGHPDAVYLDTDGTRNDMGFLPHLITDADAISDWYVSYQGQDLDATGSLSNPFGSVRSAMNFSTSGDNIWVLPGTIQEAQSIRNEGRVLTLSGTTDDGSSIIAGPAGQPVIMFEHGSSSTTQIQHITFREGSRGLSIVNSSPSISDCIVEDNSEAGVYISGANIAPTFDRLTIRNNQPRAIYIYAADPVFSDCQVHNNGTYAQGDGAGVYVDGDSADPDFTRCLFYENACSRGGVLFAQQDSYTRFVNCTLYGNGASSNGRTLWLEDYSGTADAELLNCIIWNSVGQGSVIYVENSSCVLTANYSNIQDGWNGTGNYNLDPEFVDGSTADFRLYSHSIAVNHGHPDAVYLDTDGTRNDMGYLPHLITDADAVSDWYVSSQGQDLDATGSLSNPFGSVRSAMNFSTSGDNIWVLPGTIQEAQSIRNEGRVLTLSGTTDDGSSIIAGPAGQPVIMFEHGSSSTTQIQHITFREGSRGLSIVNSSPSISDCIVEDNSEAGVYISGANIAPTFDRLTIRNNQPRAIYIYAADPVFSDCQVHNNGSYFQGDGAGVYVDGDSANPVFTRCLFYENVCSRGGVLFAQQESYTRFVNCTLYGNGASSNGRTLWLEDYSGTADAELLNCIIWNSVGQGSVIYVENSSCVLTANYSIIQDGWNGTGNYNLDPEFVDGSTSDFRLYSHSIAVNHGHPDAVYLDIDGTRNDMGYLPHLITEADAVSDWYVSSQGQDLDATGSLSNPFGSVRSAMNFSTSGDNIWVLPGTIQEAQSIRNEGRVLTLSGTTDDGSSIIAGPAGQPVIMFEHGCSESTAINHLKFSGGSFGIKIVSSSPMISNCIIENVSDTGIYLSSSNSIINDCHIIGSVLTGASVIGSNYISNWNNVEITGSAQRAIYVNNADPVFSDCQVHNNGTYAQGDGAGVYVDGDSADPVFTRCLFYENVCSRGGVLFAQQESYTRFVNCTLYGNGASSNGRTLWLEDYSGTADAELLNCILWGSVGEGAVIYRENSSCVLTVNYSDIQDGWNGTGNINADPWLYESDETACNLFLLSPCIDRGNPDVEFNDPNGSRNDMGAIPFEADSQVDQIYGFVLHESSNPVQGQIILDGDSLTLASNGLYFHTYNHDDSFSFQLVADDLDLHSELIRTSAENVFVQNSTGHYRWDYYLPSKLSHTVSESYLLSESVVENYDTIEIGDLLDIEIQLDGDYYNEVQYISVWSSLHPDTLYFPLIKDDNQSDLFKTALRFDEFNTDTSQALLEIRNNEIVHIGRYDGSVLSLATYHLPSEDLASIVLSSLSDGVPFANTINTDSLLVQVALSQRSNHSRCKIVNEFSAVELDIELIQDESGLYSAAVALGDLLNSSAASIRFELRDYPDIMRRVSYFQHDSLVSAVNPHFLDTSGNTLLSIAPGDTFMVSADNQAPLRMISHEDETGFPVWSQQIAFDEQVDTNVFGSPAEYNGHLYYVSVLADSWTGARDRCVANGGHLVSITTLEENSFVRNYVNAQLGAQDIWIGFSDLINEGQWLWESGEDYSWTNWSPGEPNNAGGEDFGEQLASGLWNDIGSQNQYFVLELPASSQMFVASELTDPGRGMLKATSSGVISLLDPANDGVISTLAVVPDELSTFSLVAPSSFSTDVDVYPSFEWTSAGDGGISYELHVSTSPTFSPEETTVFGPIIGTSYYPEVDLLVNTTYFWKVKAISGGVEEIWADTGFQDFWMLTTVSQQAGVFPMIDRQITMNRTLRRENSPYWLSQNPYTNSGTTFRILAGTSLVFADTVSLAIGGTIEVLGTETDSVRFLPLNDDSYWQGIELANDDVELELDVNDNYLSGNLIRYTEWRNAQFPLNSEADIFIKDARINNLEGYPYIQGLVLGENSVLENVSVINFDWPGYSATASGVTGGRLFKSVEVEHSANYGIHCSENARLIDVTAQYNRGFGIFGGIEFVDVLSNHNGSYGIDCNPNAELTRVEASFNHTFGCREGSRFESCTFYSNGNLEDPANSYGVWANSGEFHHVTSRSNFGYGFNGVEVFSNCIADSNASYGVNGAQFLSNSIVSNNQSYGITCSSLAELHDVEIFANSSFGLNGGMIIERCNIYDNASYGLSCNSNARVVNCEVRQNGQYGINGSSHIIESLISGNATYGVSCNTDATIARCEIMDNASFGLSGAIRLEDCLISNNGDYGLSCNIEATISRCEVTDNAGFGISGARLIEDCTISRNASFALRSEAACEVYRTDFNDNFVQNSDLIYAAELLSFRGNTVSNNTLTDTNACDNCYEYSLIRAYCPDLLEFSDNNIFENELCDNGIYLTYLSDARVENNTFRDNANIISGNPHAWEGAVSKLHLSAQMGDTLHFVANLFEGNDCYLNGTLLIQGSGEILIESSTFTDNHLLGTESKGAAIYIEAAHANVLSNTFTYNEAAQASVLYSSTGCLGEFKRNIVSNNTGLYAVWSDADIVSQCNFFFNYGVNDTLRNFYYTGPEDVTYPYNFWGTRSDQGNIDPSIYDDNESGGLSGLVAYQPILTGPSGQTPGQLSVVDSVYVSLSNVVLAPQEIVSLAEGFFYVVLSGVDGNSFSQDYAEVLVTNLSTGFPLQPLCLETEANSGNFVSMMEISESTYDPVHNIMRVAVGDTLLLQSSIDTQIQSRVVVSNSLMDLPTAFNLSEDTPLSIDFAPYIHGPTAEDSYLYCANTEHLQVETQLYSYDVLITPAENWFGEESLEFQLLGLSGDLIVAAQVQCRVEAVNDPPIVISELGQFVLQEGSLDNVLQLSDHFMDIDGDELLYSCSGSFEDHISVMIDGDIARISSLDAWNGTLLATFIADDQRSRQSESRIFENATGRNGRDTAAMEIEIIVVPVNNSPQIILPEQVEFSEDQSLDFNIESFVYDGDSEQLFISAESNTTNLFVEAEGFNLHLHASENWNGLGSIIVSVSDGDRLSAIDSMLVNVLAVNDSPQLSNESRELSMNEDESLQLQLNDYFFDVDEDELSFELINEGGEELNYELNSNVLTVFPDLNWNGEETFTVRADDSYTLLNQLRKTSISPGRRTSRSRVSVDATFTLTVHPVNDPPICMDLTLETQEDTSLQIAFAGNDVDYDELSFEVFNVQHGSFDGDAFTPEENYFGTSTLNYVAFDGQAYSDTSDVNITIHPVNDAPEAYNSQVSIAIDVNESLILDMNDFFTDVDGDPLSYDYDGSQYVQISQNGNIFTINPQIDWSGEAEVHVAANDNQTRLVAECVFYFEVGDVNNAPIIELPDSFSFQEDEILTINMTDYISDPDFDQLQIVANEGQNLTYVISNMLLQASPVQNWNGSEMLYISVSDRFSRITVNDSCLVIVDPINDPPVAFAQLIETSEDNDIFIELTAYDVDGDSLSFNVVEYPANGLYENDIYTPNPDFFGDDEIIFFASDGEFDSPAVSVGIVVTAVNDRPISYDVEVVVSEDSQNSLDFSGFDVDGDVLSYFIDTMPINGSYQSGLYTPNEDFVGLDSLYYYCSDGQLNSNTSIARINVIGSNDAPVIELPEFISFEEDHPSIYDFSSYCYDIDNDDIVLNSVGGQHVQVEIIDFEVSFTSDENWFGEESIVFSLDDQNGRLISTDILLVEVVPVNDAPTVDSGEVWGDEDNPISVTFSGNDVDGDNLDFVIQQNPQHGIVDDLVYYPYENYFGPDSILYSATDGFLYSEMGLIVINVASVNDAPELQHEEFYSFVEDDELSVDFSQNVFDVDGDELTLTAQSSDNVFLSINGFQCTFSAAENWFGTEAVSLQLDDAQSRDLVSYTFDVIVTAVNDSPYLLQALGILELLPGESHSFNLDDYFSDVDNSTLDYSYSGNSALGVELSGSSVFIQAPVDWTGSEDITFQASDGQSSRLSIADILTVFVSESPNNPPTLDLPSSFTFAEDGVLNQDFSSYANDPDGDALFLTVLETINIDVDITGFNVSLSAESDWFGEEWLVFVVQDRTQRLSASDSSLVIVDSVNDPPVAIDSEFECFEDSLVLIEFNGFDVDNDNLLVDIIDGPINGYIDGNIYVPNPDFFGTDEIHFVLNDAQYSSEIGLISINVLGLNDVPVAYDSYLQCNEDEELILVYDAVDVDGDDLIFDILSGPFFGQVIDGFYYPMQDYSGTDSLSYSASDALDSSLPATVFIDILSINDAPTFILPDEFNMMEDSFLDVDMSEFVNDVDSEDLVLSVSSNVHIHCEISNLNALFWADENWFGSEMINLTIDDGDRLSVIDSVQVVVQGVNDSPIASDIIINTEEDLPVIINYEVFDVDGDELSIIIIDGPTFGEIVDGSYLPQIDFYGGDSFLYQASDGTLSSSTALATINVSPVNDPPLVSLIPGPNSVCGLIEDLGNSPGATDGFIPDWMNGIIQLQLTDVDSDSLHISYFINQVHQYETTVATSNISLPYWPDIELFFFYDIEFHVEVDDGEAEVWNLQGTECAWQLDFLALDFVDIPLDFYLMPAEPNPFNPSTTIRFGLTHPQEVTLSVFNVSGQCVDIIQSGEFSAGHHKIVWNAEEHSSGVYLLVFAGEGRFEVRKMMLLK